MKKSKQNKTRTIIDSLARDVAAAYPHDVLTAGLVIAYLPDERRFYASIVRYPNRACKRVVQKAHGRTANEAVMNLARAWERRDTLGELPREDQSSFDHFSLRSSPIGKPPALPPPQPPPTRPRTVPDTYDDMLRQLYQRYHGFLHQIFGRGDGR